MRWRPLLPWLLALGVVLIFLAVQGRYVLRGTSRGVAYRMDRWTGEVLFIAGSSSYRVTPAKVETKRKARGRYGRLLEDKATTTEAPPRELGAELSTDVAD